VSADGSEAGAGTGAQTADQAAARVRLLSRPGCHLCDDARAVVAAVCADLGVSWDEVDITTDPELDARYREQIPVTLVDGRQHDFWRVDAGRLRAALAG
jgi:glutaredoxin